MEPIIEVEQAAKLHRNGRGIRDISLTVYRGDIFGLFGPNGAGKTTLLKLITGLCAPDRGNVRLFGHPVAERFEQAMKRVGCLIETADAYEYMSAYDQMRMAARFYPDLPAGRIAETLECVGLTPYAHEKVRNYSLGMKQKLAIALALLSEPELVILDEPTNGLDIEGRVEFRNLVWRLAREKGIAFLISSHLIQEMERQCNRIGILYGGSLIRQGTMEELTGEGQTSLEQLYLSEIQQVKGSAAHA